MITTNFFGIDTHFRGFGGYSLQVTHIYLKEPGRFIIKYSKYVDGQRRTYIVEFNLVEGIVAHNADREGNATNLQLIPSGVEGYELIRVVDTYDFGSGRFHDNDRLYENLSISLDDTNAPTLHLREDQFPYTVLEPSNDPGSAAALVPEQTLYPHYPAVERAGDHNLAPYTQAETRLGLVKFVSNKLLEQVERIMSLTEDENERKTAQLYMAYLFNQALYMHNDSNRTDHAIYEDYLNLVDLDTFFAEFPISEAGSAANLELKQKMYSHDRIYRYADGEIILVKSAVAGETGETNPAISPAYATSDKHQKVREMFNLHPIQAHSETRLDNLQVWVNPDTRVGLVPRFDPDVTAYTATVARGSTVVNHIATKKNDHQTVAFTGDVALPTDPEILSWTVTSLNGDTKTYTVTVDQVDF